jgi:hypothetical protein
MFFAEKLAIYAHLFCLNAKNAAFPNDLLGFNDKKIMKAQTNFANTRENIVQNHAYFENWSCFYIHVVNKNFNTTGYLDIVLYGLSEEHSASKYKVFCVFNF